MILKKLSNLKLEKTITELKDVEKKLSMEREEKQLLQQKLKEKENFVKQLQERLERKIFDLLRIAEKTHQKELLELKLENEAEMDVLRKMVEQKINQCECGMGEN